MDRRDFIRAGIAASALPAAAGIIRAAQAACLPAPGRAGMDSCKVIIDTRFAESKLFMNEMVSRGADIQTITGDVTRLWLVELGSRWRKESLFIAGLTDYDILYCLELLALRAGARLIYLASHRLVATRPLEHVVSSSESLNDPARSLHAAGVSWPSQAAALVAKHVSASESVARGLAPRAAIDLPQTHSLHSWVIAPAQHS